MTKLIALCDGHGMETAGKRTPLLPNGTVMRENEFNRAVVALLDIHLRRCGFRTLLVAPTDVDTPLSARTALANRSKADLYVSVHANAAGVGWNSARGIETFCFPGSVAGRKAAEAIHRQLIKGTPMPNRGVKEQNFQVLRETNMPAVLVECEFMTNLEGANLLMSAAYRAECTEEIARGICDYYGVPYRTVVEVKPAPTKPAPTKPAPTKPAEEAENTMKPEDANKIIKFVQAAYNAIDSKDARLEFNRLANELRKASGQPTQ